MQRFFYYALRTYVSAGMRFYFRKILIRGRENISQARPMIFAANHQNAFLDALLIVTTNNTFTHFLARADVFKKAAARGMLSLLNMIPVFRIRDGWESLDKNKETFQACVHVFSRGESIVIFPEGNHGSQRRLRPLSRGFTKIAFEALRTNAVPDLSIIPVGLNFSNPREYFSDVAVIYGKPIRVKDYDNSPQGANQLRDDLAEALRHIITHIDPVEHYEAIHARLEATNPDYLDPQGTNQRLQQLDAWPTPYKKATMLAVRLIAYLFQFIFVLPNVIPLIIWSMIRNKIKDPVFVASVKFGTGIFLFPVVYAAEIYVLSLFVQPWTLLLCTLLFIASMPLMKTAARWIKG